MSAPERIWAFPNAAGDKYRGEWEDCPPMNLTDDIYEYVRADAMPSAPVVTEKELAEIIAENCGGGKWERYIAAARAAIAALQPSETVSDAARVLEQREAYFYDPALFAIVNTIRKHTEGEWEPSIHGTVDIAKAFLSALAQQEADT